MPEDTSETPKKSTRSWLSALLRLRVTPRIAACVLAAVLLVVLVVLWTGGESLTGLLLGEGEDLEKIQVDASTFKDYFTVDRKLVGPGGRTLILTLKRAKGFPLKDADFERIPEGSPRISALLPFEAVARGYVRCEYFTQKNEFLGFTFERIRGLAERETIEVSLPISGRRGLHHVVITY